MRAIYGERSDGEKKAALDDSLARWWANYSERKEDADDQVADTLLYGDRCHLPR